MRTGHTRRSSRHIRMLQIYHARLLRAHPSPPTLLTSYSATYLAAFYETIGVAKYTNHANSSQEHQPHKNYAYFAFSGNNVSGISWDSTTTGQQTKSSSQCHPLTPAQHSVLPWHRCNIQSSSNMVQHSVRRLRTSVPMTQQTERTRVLRGMCTSACSLNTTVLPAFV